MFNLFPKKKSVEELVDSVGPFDVYRPVQTPSILQAQNDLIEQFLKENHDLKAENQKLKDEIKKWEHDWDIQNDNIKRLERENIDLTDRVNEIDSDVIRDLKDEILVLKNDHDVLRGKYIVLQEKYNGMVNQGGLKFMEAKLQIVQNNYTTSSKERDEFKHQLNAANKEIEALKSKLRDCQDKYAESFSNNDMDKLQKEIEILKRWKKEQLTVQSWWDKVDSYVRDHDDAPLGGIVANTCLNFLKQRDEYKNKIETLEKEYEIRLKELNNGLVDVTRENKKFCRIIEEQNKELKKLKDDIVDYVFEKDDEINELKKTHDPDDFDPSDYEVTWISPSLNIEQKHPMYPIHWGGYDGAASAHPEEYKKWLYEQRDKAIAEKQREEEKWICPCNKCKEQRGE